MYTYIHTQGMHGIAVTQQHLQQHLIFKYHERKDACTLADQNTFGDCIFHLVLRLAGDIGSFGLRSGSVGVANLQPARLRNHATKMQVCVLIERLGGSMTEEPVYHTDCQALNNAQRHLFMQLADRRCADEGTP